MDTKQKIEKVNEEAASRLNSSSWIEPHQAAAVSYYRGSDWIERHPSIGAASYNKGSDWIERHPSLVVSGSSSTRMDYSLEKHLGEGGK